MSCSIQICLFPQWQELEKWLAENENSRFDLWKWPIGWPSEDLHLEFCSAYFHYVDIWERIHNRHASEDEQKAINRVALFGSEWKEVPMATLKSGKILTKLERTNREELSLEPNAYGSDFWGYLFFALKPQSVRDVCDAAKEFEIGNYKTRFYALENRGAWFKNDETSEPFEDFENFKSYHASWQACFAEAAQENCGLLVFGW